MPTLCLPDVTTHDQASQAFPSIFVYCKTGSRNGQKQSLSLPMAESMQVNWRLKIHSIPGNACAVCASHNKTCHSLDYGFTVLVRVFMKHNHSTVSSGRPIQLRCDGYTIGRYTIGRYCMHNCYTTHLIASC